MPFFKRANEKINAKEIVMKAGFRKTTDGFKL